jgi:DNA mismatch endonuclease, patch repair protein
MRRVRRSGTEAEINVRRALRELGVRYRLNVRSLPGSPDIVNRARGFAIFVHGCYWHRHQGCVRTTTPTRNREFWVEKFDANVARDARNSAALRALGYDVCVIWECESENRQALKRRLKRVVQGTSKRRQY